MDRSLLVAILGRVEKRADNSTDERSVKFVLASQLASVLYPRHAGSTCALLYYRLMNFPIRFFEASEVLVYPFISHTPDNWAGCSILVGLIREAGRSPHSHTLMPVPVSLHLLPRTRVLHIGIART